jgi:hypothetical protein
MQNVLTAAMAVLLCASLSFAQRITENVADWTFGPNLPTVQTGTRGDGSSGAYHYLPVGTSAYYYEVMIEGEGLVELWVYDPAKCMADPDPGYGTNGPRWGLQNPLYQSLSVGVGRPAYVAGCQGYSPWSTVSPYSYLWFKDGIRGSKGVSWTAGWWKWSLDGKFDNLVMTLYNVTYCIDDGPPNDDLTTGDCVQTYDATTGGAMWAALFGSGWKALWLKGDEASTGIEDINVDVMGGTGVFIEMGLLTPPAVSQTYNQTSWGTIKSLYR